MPRALSGGDRPGSFAGNSLRVLAGQVAGNAGYFAAVLVLAHGLRPAQRGAVAFVTVTALIVGTLAMLGAGDAVRVLAATRPGERPTLLTNLALIVLAASVAGAAIAVGALVTIPGARPPRVGRVDLVLLAGGVVAAAGGFAAASFLQGCSRFGTYTRAVAASPWVYAVLLVAAWAHGGLTVHRAVAAWTTAQGLPAVVLWLVCARAAGFGRPDLRLLRETVSFGLRAWIGSLAHFLNARADQVILGLIASEAALGTYAVAVNASEMLFYLPSAAGAALVPAMARTDGRTAARRTAHAFRVVLLLTAVAIGAAALLGPPLLPIVFGAPYRHAAVPFLLLLPGGFGFTASAMFSSALLAARRPGFSSLGPLVALVTQTALDLVLIPAHGAAGAAVAASAALACGGVAACAAYCVIAEISPVMLVPRPADITSLAGPLRQLRSRLAIRRTGLSRS